MTIKYLKKATKTASTDDTKTKEIVQKLLNELEKSKEEGCKELTKKFDKYDGEIIVSKENIFDVLTKLHSNSSIPFDQLIDITAIDYPENLPRFEMVYLLLSTVLKKRLTVKILVNEGDLIKSCVSIFKSANWSEREIWDMFGIFFSGHPDLRLSLIHI